jgi:uncharacterized membrane protein YjjB (DUF3815 family)
MVPGVFTYKMMIGFVQLATDDSISYQALLDTFRNGLNALLILLSLALGVALPRLLSRRDTKN